MYILFLRLRCAGQDQTHSVQARSGFSKMLLDFRQFRFGGGNFVLANRGVNLAELFEASDFGGEGFLRFGDRGFN
jgi:hypothetical protein